MFKFKGIQISLYEAQLNINIYLFKLWEKKFLKKKPGNRNFRKKSKFDQVLGNICNYSKIKKFCAQPFD